MCSYCSFLGERYMQSRFVFFFSLSFVPAGGEMYLELDPRSAAIRRPNGKKGVLYKYCKKIKYNILWNLFTLFQEFYLWVSEPTMAPWRRLGSNKFRRVTFQMYYPLNGYCSRINIIIRRLTLSVKKDSTVVTARRSSWAGLLFIFRDNSTTPVDLNIVDVVRARRSSPFLEIGDRALISVVFRARVFFPLLCGLQSPRSDYNLVVTEV